MSWRPLADISVLQRRAQMLGQVREFFADRSVVEVQTPLLGSATVTDPDVQAIAVPGYGFLQTSPEYFMKRLLAAGMPSCYQLASAFRHEEQGRIHNPEFTMLEWYRLGFDDVQLRAEVSALCDLLLGKGAYHSVTYPSLVGDLERPREELDLAFAEACAALTDGRYFVTDYPAEQAALAQLRSDDPRWASRFELIVNGVEVANGYYELTDPQVHGARFANDLQVRTGRGLDAVQIDEEFLSALEAGLPACAGVAMGFDRLVMLALGAQSLDQVLAFRG